MKIAFTTLGCKLNYAETSTWERSFLDAGWEVVPWSGVADVYLVNTCAVTETAEKKSRNYIRRAHKTAPDAKIVVTGCYAELRKEQLQAIEGVWKVFGTKQKAGLVTNVREAVEDLEGTPSGNNATLGLEGGAHLWEGPAQPEFSEPIPSGAYGIRIIGLMGMATNTDDMSVVEKDFERIEALFNKLKAQYPQITELSIGMSGDWPLAVKHGATMVRIGTDIFGPREY